MKWLTFEIQRASGFRFNLVDLTLILFLLLLAYTARHFMPQSSLFWIPIYVGISFFLFCNVFRIGNRLEPWWYIPFFAAAVYALASLRLELFWWSVLVFFEPLKWGLIIYHIRYRSYHGAFYKYLGK